MIANTGLLAPDRFPCFIAAVTFGILQFEAVVERYARMNVLFADSTVGDLDF